MADRTGVADIASAMGVTPQAVWKRAARDQWSYEEVAARGGRKRLYLISSLPDDVRAALAEKALSAASTDAVSPSPVVVGASSSSTAHAAPAPSAVVVRERSVGDLAQWQIDVATARAALLDECERTAVQTSISFAKAAEILCSSAKAGTLSAELAELARLANARRGEGRTLSVARIWAWRKEVRGALTPAERIGRLAPEARGKRWTLTDDVAAVLAKFRQPNKPSLRWCVKEIVGEDGGHAFNSLYQRCRRELEKLPAPVVYAGRHSGAALRALQPFRRRDFLSLQPNDVWTGDGHSAKLTIAHPETGNRFVPEVTLTVDVATRYVVGYSVSASENCLAVSDALRHAVSRHGIPLIYYSDNGAGQKNKMFDAPVTGVLGALGIHHEVGRPGNPQGRGVIERIWQTILIPLAKRFATYQGNGADRETLRRVSRDIDRALRAVSRGEVTALPSRLPRFREFMEALDLEIEIYNTTHRHRSLPKLDGVVHATPAEFRAYRLAGAEPQIPQPQELAALFMPAERRIAARGEVKFWNGIYYHRDLMLVDREEVMVSYDVHDASYVLVRKLSGEFIARAELAGNRDGYMPQPLVERLREDRAARRLQRLETKIDDVKAELRGSTIPAQAHEPIALDVAAAALAPAPVNVLDFRSDADRHTYWKSLDARRRSGDALTEQEEAWWEHWQGDDYFIRMQREEAEFQERMAAS